MKSLVIAAIAMVMVSTFAACNGTAKKTTDADSTDTVCVDSLDSVQCDTVLCDSVVQ